MFALACGLLLLRWMPVLPPGWVLLLLSAFALPLLFTRAYFIGLFLLGFAWACQSAQWALDDRLARELDGRTLWLEGRVEGLPDRTGPSVRFMLTDVTSPRLRVPATLRVSWFGGPPVEGGERWRLAVKLKRPHGMVNGAGFDYEAWLTAQRIGATGSVKDGQRLQSASGPNAWREAWRQRLLAVDAHGRSGALAALVLGDASGLTPADWQVLQDTGTLHLMVISGSHISLLAGLLYALIAALARFGCWPARLPWLPCACLLAAAGAWSYSLMAGFDVPLQRACIMVSIVLLWRLRYRHRGLWTPLLGALLAVLLAEPLVVLLPGFWLSYAAVALLIFGFSGRLGRWTAWRTWLRAQWLMAVGLLPASIALGLPLSISSVIANLVAVPWVEMAVVPLALLGSLSLGLPWVGEALLWVSGWLLDLLFQWLGWMAGLAPAWQPVAAPAWALSVAMLGALLLLAPAGMPLRALGLAMFLPVFWPTISRPPPGQAEIRVLDVGQGLSVLIRTRNHAWLYDTGARNGDFDIGERVVVPTLRSLGIDHLDMLMLSHADNDHAGGAPAVKAALRPAHVVSGEPDRLPAELRAAPCPGTHWDIDGVRLSSWAWKGARESNDRSCVLEVTADGERLLLTGDLPQPGEIAWLAEHPGVHIDWLLAGHHGSRSSSGPIFLRAIGPSAALISRGANNPYGHPHPSVVERFRALGIRIHDTAEQGALTLMLGAHGELRGVREGAHFWQEN
ncbi:DNA internalization-related competence protein ComEC/Rec2 [Pseudomonas sp. PDNC002]|uniref:DNA internalization-related competence protein ComEC/Rec2 n=1 Tax=Pseudomonas sp. PDNC002 TaxID=2811422 RepID=UPI0019665278|nr:DNA internalization-related competence protein ComEC/Rec2 [Pseudomonas sp. PDNC002]QRY82504.1 DNA internalization-related competence protein ComEC/Rec2 [Pseudomonas sp. PDNC002]